MRGPWRQLRRTLSSGAWIWTSPNLRSGGLSFIYIAFFLKLLAFLRWQCKAKPASYHYLTCTTHSIFPMFKIYTGIPVCLWSHLFRMEMWLHQSSPLLRQAGHTTMTVMIMMKRIASEEEAGLQSMVDKRRQRPDSFKRKMRNERVSFCLRQWLPIMVFEGHRVCKVLFQPSTNTPGSANLCH